MHPRFKHWHLLDYLIVRQRDRKEVLDTRVMRGVDCGTDHAMLRYRLRIINRIRHHKTGMKPPSKLNTSALKGKEKQDELTKELDNKLKKWDIGNADKEIEK